MPFFSMKFKSSSLKEMFCVTKMLDFFEDSVANLYRSKLSERGLEDEFDVENVITRRMPAEDTNFYKRVFFPAAILFTYQDRHPNCNLRPLHLGVRVKN